MIRFLPMRIVGVAGVCLWVVVCNVCGYTFIHPTARIDVRCPVCGSTSTIHEMRGVDALDLRKVEPNDNNN